MRSLSLNEMNSIEGGKHACISMALGFAGAFAATFLGPAGIPLGVGMFARGVMHAGDCEKEGW